MSKADDDIPLQLDEVKWMEGALQAHEREKWNQRYLEGTHGKLPPDQLLIDAFDRYIEPLFPNAGHALDIAGGGTTDPDFLF